MHDLVYLVIISIVVGIITGLIVKRSGYSFVRYAITGFLASMGILALFWKILKDYL